VPRLVARSKLTPVYGPNRTRVDIALVRNTGRLRIVDNASTRNHHSLGIASALHTDHSNPDLSIPAFDGMARKTNGH
jgi:hypothetical protein